MNYKAFVLNSVRKYSYRMECNSHDYEDLRHKKEAIKFFKEYFLRNLVIMEDHDLWIDEETIKMVLCQLQIFIQTFPFSSHESQKIRRELQRVVLFINHDLKSLKEEKINDFI